MSDTCKCKRRYDDGYSWWSCPIHGRTTHTEYETDIADDEESREPRRPEGGRDKNKDKNEDDKSGDDKDNDDDGDGDDKRKPPKKKAKNDDDGDGDGDGDGTGKERRRSNTGWWDEP